VIRHVTSPDAPAPGGPYSHAVIAGNLMFLSGQRPVDPRTGEIPSGIVSQTRRVLSNVMTVLAEEGRGPGDVAKVTIYLDDIADFDQVNAVYREFFSEPYPARTTIAATLRGILVEIDVIAVAD
jgi:2-iminobutanoate/2-iminopropanoate deaminase